MTEIGGNIVKAVDRRPGRSPAGSRPRGVGQRRLPGRPPQEDDGRRKHRREGRAPQDDSQEGDGEEGDHQEDDSKEGYGEEGDRRSQLITGRRRNQAPQRSAPGPAPSACRCPTAAASAPKSGRPGTTPTARTDRKASPKYYARDEMGSTPVTRNEVCIKPGMLHSPGRVVKQT